MSTRPSAHDKDQDHLRSRRASDDASFVAFAPVERRVHSLWCVRISVLRRRDHHAMTGETSLVARHSLSWQVMANYRITIQVAMPREPLFAYLTTLSNARNWEPTVSAASDTNGEPLESGRTFEIEARAPTRVRKFTYKIVEFEPPQHSVLEAITRSFYSRITINVRKIDDETSEMVYESALRRRGFSAIFNSLLFISMRRNGKRARHNLERVLTAMCESAPSPNSGSLG